MRFSIATLSLAALTVVSASYVTRGEGVSRGEKYECDFDTFEWKFGLAVKELKHRGKNWGKDVDLDIVYESDDGQLYHGCKDTYDASKCKTVMKLLNSVMMMMMKEVIVMIMIAKEEKGSQIC